MLRGVECEADCFRSSRSRERSRSSRCVRRRDSWRGVRESRGADGADAWPFDEVEAGGGAGGCEVWSGMKPPDMMHCIEMGRVVVVPAGHHKRETSSLIIYYWVEVNYGPGADLAG